MSSEFENFMEKCKDVKLDLSVLEGYKNEPEYIASAKKKLEVLKKVHPEIVNDKYASAFEHGFIEASVDSYEEIKKLKFMIDNGLGWEDLKNDVSYPPRD